MGKKLGKLRIVKRQNFDPDIEFLQGEAKKKPRRIGA